MGVTNLALKTLAVISFLFAGGLFASSCSTSAYRQSCASCLLPDGKMDKECYNSQQSAGISCLSYSHPVAAAAYASGKCPGIDACSAELTSCKGRRSTGNDSYDCNEGSVASCFTDADLCVDKAAVKCGESAPGGGSICPLPTGLIMLLIGGVFLAGFMRKE